MEAHLLLLRAQDSDGALRSNMNGGIQDGQRNLRLCCDWDSIWCGPGGGSMYSIGLSVSAIVVGWAVSRRTGGVDEMIDKWESVTRFDGEEEQAGDWAHY